MVVFRLLKLILKYQYCHCDIEILTQSLLSLYFQIRLWRILFSPISSLCQATTSAQLSWLNILSAAYRRSVSSGLVILLKIIFKWSTNLLSIWRKVVDRVLMNNSPSNIFWILLLLERYHLHCEAILAATGMNSLTPLHLKGTPWPGCLVSKWPW